MLDSLPRCILQFVCLVVREIVGANTMITLVVMTSKVWVAQSSGLEYLIHTDTHCRPGEQKVVQKPAKWWGLKQAYLYTAHIFTHLRVDQSTPHNIYIYMYLYIYMHMYVNTWYIHTHIYIYTYLFIPDATGKRIRTRNCVCWLMIAWHGAACHHYQVADHVDESCEFLVPQLRMGFPVKHI